MIKDKFIIIADLSTAKGISSGLSIGLKMITDWNDINKEGIISSLENIEILLEKSLTKIMKENEDKC